MLKIKNKKIERKRGCFVFFFYDWSASQSCNPSKSLSFSLSAQGADLQIIDKDDNPSLADTIAAVTIAVLACVLIITLTLIVRAIRKRRQRQRGQELNRIPTVSTGIISASEFSSGCTGVVW